MDWLLKSEKIVLMNSNETRNSCIHIRFCTLAICVLWAHIIANVGYWGCASSLLQTVCVAIATTATAGIEVESYKTRPQPLTYFGRIIVFCVTENRANTSRNYLRNRPSSHIRPAPHGIWKGPTMYPPPHQIRMCQWFPGNIKTFSHSSLCTQLENRY
jgi:hypothetical protein